MQLDDSLNVRCFIQCDDDQILEPGVEICDISLPKGLAIKKSQIPGAGEGIWTTASVKKGVRFGPYGGKRTKDEDKARMSGYSWQVSTKDKDKAHMSGYSCINSSIYTCLLWCALLHLSVRSTTSEAEILMSDSDILI